MPDHPGGSGGEGGVFEWLLKVNDEASSPLKEISGALVSFFKGMEDAMKKQEQLFEKYNQLLEKSTETFNGHVEAQEDFGRHVEYVSDDIETEDALLSRLGLITVPALNEAIKKNTAAFSLLGEAFSKGVIEADQFAKGWKALMAEKFKLETTGLHDFSEELRATAQEVDDVRATMFKLGIVTKMDVRKAMLENAESMDRVRDAYKKGYIGIVEYTQAMAKLQIQNVQLMRGAEGLKANLAKTQQAMFSIRSEVGAAAGSFGVLGTLVGGLSFASVIALGVQAAASMRELTKSLYPMTEATNMSAKEWEAATAVVNKYDLALGFSRDELARVTGEVAALGRAQGLHGDRFNKFLKEGTTNTLMFAKATGLSATESAGLFKNIGQLYFLGYDKIRQFGNSFKYLSDQTGVSKSELSRYMQGLQEFMSRLPGATKKDADKLLLNFTAVGAAIKQLGGDAEGFAAMLTDSLSNTSETGRQKLAGLSTLMMKSGTEVRDMIKRGDIAQVFKEVATNIQGMFPGDMPFEQFESQTRGMQRRLGMTAKDLWLLKQANLDTFDANIKGAMEAGKKQDELSKATKHHVVSFSEQLEGMNRRINKAITDAFGADLLELFEKFVTKTLIPALKDFSEWWGKLDMKTKGFYQTLGFIALAFTTLGKPILWLVTTPFKMLYHGIEFLVTAGPRLVTMLGNWGKYASFLAKGAGFAGGLLEAIPVIGAFISILFSLPKTIGDIIDRFKKFGVVRGILGTLFGDIPGIAFAAADKFFFGLPSWISKKLGGIGLNEIGKNLGDMIIDLADTPLVWIEDKIGAIYKTIRFNWSNIPVYFKAWFWDAAAIAERAFNYVMVYAKKAFWDVVVSAKHTFVDPARELINEFTVWFDGWWESLPYKAKSAFWGVVAELEAPFIEMGNIITRWGAKAHDIVLSAKNKIVDIWVGYSAFFKGLWDDLRIFFDKLWDKIKDSAGSVFGKITDAMSWLTEKLGMDDKKEYQKQREERERRARELAATTAMPVIPAPTVNVGAPNVNVQAGLGQQELAKMIALLQEQNSILRRGGVAVGVTGGTTKEGSLLLSGVRQ